MNLDRAKEGTQTERRSQWCSSWNSTHCTFTDLFACRSTLSTLRFVRAVITICKVQAERRWYYFDILLRYNALTMIFVRTLRRFRIIHLKRQKFCLATDDIDTWLDLEVDSRWSSLSWYTIISSINNTSIIKLDLDLDESNLVRVSFTIEKEIDQTLLIK